jgi:hypothetical protein
LRLQSIKPIEPVTLQEEDAMYRDWKPGDWLVCVDSTPPPLTALWLFRSWICSGQVYTLRQLVIPAPGGPNPGPGVYLAEIRNPIEPESGFEYGYLAYRFEKLEEGTVVLPFMAGRLRGVWQTWQTPPPGREPSKTALQRVRRPEISSRPEDRSQGPLRAPGGQKIMLDSGGESSRMGITG